MQDSLFTCELLSGFCSDMSTVWVMRLVNHQGRSQGRTSCVAGTVLGAPD